MKAEINFDERGLIPCVTQDQATGEVLTLAYMNAESLRLTLETGQVHYFSRSRQEIWHKGETSGNLQMVADLRLDCDGDAILALVDPAGPACHTGERTCFHRDVPGAGGRRPVAFEALAALERTIAERSATASEGSYTTLLLADPELAGAKITEEAEEVVRAVREESDDRVAEEAADLTYHLAVLRASRGVSKAAVDKVLNGRRR